MHLDYPSRGIRTLCRLFGKTRHAYYDKQWRQKKNGIEHAIVLELVSQIRQEQPRLGTDKLYLLIKNALKQHQIKLGRDNLHELLHRHGLTIRRRRRRVRTTDSDHPFRKYPNLIRNLVLTAPEQLWVCDITYISLKAGFSYLSLITDAYSRKITGYCLHEKLDNKGCIAALEKALKSRKLFDHPLIHHSDRGIQYCSQAYVDILGSQGLSISMTEKGDPYENAIAERVNGILKTELGLSKTFDDHPDATAAVERSILIYNEKRPHASCDFLTPSQAHQQKGILRKRWKHRPFRPKQGYEQINTY